MKVKMTIFVQARAWFIFNFIFQNGSKMRLKMSKK